MPAPTGETRWFAMLNTGEPPAEWQRLARELEGLTGASVDALPHVTVGWGQGQADLGQVAAAFASVVGPQVRLRVRPPVDYHQSERLHFRWTVALAVEKDETLRAWHARAQQALRAAGVAAPDQADEWGPHVTVLRGSDRRPALDEELQRAAIALLEERAPALRLPAVRLHVSRLSGGRFQKVIERALSGDGSVHP